MQLRLVCLLVSAAAKIKWQSLPLQKHSYGKVLEAHVASSDSCVNGSSTVQVLSIKETGHTYISAQIHQLPNSQGYEVLVNMDWAL